MKKVTFITTIYNKESYLDRTLKSIKEQTGNFAKEYIFVDDCSTDNSLKKLKELTKGWKNIVIHKMKSNSGVCQATKKGIEFATGDYIKFVDGDDVLFPDTTNKLLNVSIKYKVPCIYCQHIKIGTNDSIRKIHSQLSSNDNVYVYRTPIKQMMHGSCLGSTPLLVRTSVAKEACIMLNTKDRSHQDYRLSLYLACRYDVAYCDIIGSYEWDTDQYKLTNYEEKVSYYDKAKALYDFIILCPELMDNDNLKNDTYNTFIGMLKLGIKSHYKYKRLYQLHKILNPIIKFKNKNLTQNTLKKYLDEYKKLLKN